MRGEGNSMKNDWVEQICDRVEQQVRQTRGDGATIICASGISPSGPVHLGNLREIMTPYIVAEALRSRGRQVEYLHFWDDFDRLRKVPAGVPAEYEAYFGCPLSDVPDPSGEYESYAARYMDEFTQSLKRLGIVPRFIQQSKLYRSGRYTPLIKVAMARRLEIFDTLAASQTLPGQQESAAERRAAYYPFRVYCEDCHKDTTTITQYDEATATISYVCHFRHYEGSFSLDEKVEGKLVWKVDWPMRWSAMQVDFEPAGEDHASPGSSFSVGRQLVQSIFRSPPPQFVGYAFVGMEGRTKISSSAGTTATPASALDIIEPCILRWLYTRRSYNQAFMIDFGQGLLRLYDEWDSLQRQIREGKANEAQRKAYERAIHTSEGDVNCTPQPVPFHLLTSVLDVTQGNVEQTLRIVAQYQKQDPQGLHRDTLEPRLSCALNWVTHYLPEDERTPICTSFQSEAYARLSELDRAGVRILYEHLDSSWNLDALTSLVYNIPKIVRDIPLDTPPNAELKQAQRSFFIAIYQLICGRETGPRIPTLLLSLGQERVKRLLSPE